MKSFWGFTASPWKKDLAMVTDPDGSLRWLCVYIPNEDLLLSNWRLWRQCFQKVNLFPTLGKSSQKTDPQRGSAQLEGHSKAHSLRHFRKLPVLQQSGDRKESGKPMLISPLLIWSSLSPYRWVWTHHQYSLSLPAIPSDPLFSGENTPRTTALAYNQIETMSFSPKCRIEGQEEIH